MKPKESGKVRYAYGVAMALLLGGTAFSLATGQAGAQVAQNSPSTPAPRRRAARRCRSPIWPLSCSRRWSTFRLSSASRSKPSPIRSRNSSGGSIPARVAAGAVQGQAGRPAPHSRGRLARLGLHHFARRLHRHQQPPGPGRQRQRHGRHRDGHHHRSQRISGPDHRPRRDVRSGPPQDRRPQPAVRAVGRQHQSARRRLGSRHRQSLWPWRQASPRASSPRFTAGSPGSAPTTATSRPMPPSTWAIAAARCSTSTATSSASTRR